MPDTFTHVVNNSAVLGLAGPWLPAAQLTMPLAERVRAALMRASGPSVPWQLSGKDADGRPRLDHAHAYYLPFSTRPDRLLDCVLVWAKGGLGEATGRVLGRLSDARIWFPGRPELRLEILDSRELDLWGLRGPARCWHSVTPFVPPRFTKRRRGALTDTPEDQLARLCLLVLGQEPTQIRPSASPRSSRFVQHRTGKDRGAPFRHAHGWHLQFSVPMLGPIALGRGAHFGLGRFAAELES